MVEYFWCSSSGGNNVFHYFRKGTVVLCYLHILERNIVAQVGVGILTGLDLNETASDNNDLRNSEIALLNGYSMFTINSDNKCRPLRNDDVHIETMYMQMGTTNLIKLLSWMEIQ